MSLDLPSLVKQNSENSWETLGRNLQHQHFSYQDIAPPLKIVWKRKINSVVIDHPLALNDYIIALTKRGGLYVIDYETGKKLSRKKLGFALAHVPSIDKNIMHIGFNLGKETLIGVNLKTGKRKLIGNYSHINTSPLIWEDKIYIATAGDLFFCIDLNSGQEIWKHKSRAVILASPALQEPSILFGDNQGWLYSLDALSGRLLWEKQLNGSIFGHPTLSDSIIFAGTVSGTMYALNIDNGREIWRLNFPGAIYGSAALFENRLYFGTNAHQVVAVDKNKGDVLWQFPTKGIVNTVPLPSPNYLYITCWDQNLYVLDRLSGKLIFKYQWKHPLKSSPIIYRNYLILHIANDHLVALANENFIQHQREEK